MSKKMNISDLFKVGFEAKRRAIAEQGGDKIIRTYELEEGQLEQFLASGNRTDEEIADFLNNTGKIVFESEMTNGKFVDFEYQDGKKVQVNPKS